MRLFWTFLLAPLMVAGVGATLTDLAQSPRLREPVGRVIPMPGPQVLGGGEVVLELAVNAGGGVDAVHAISITPPFGETVAAAVQTWRFDPAVESVDGRRVARPGRVLVLAVFRPPTFYAGPAPGGPRELRGEVSDLVPQPGSLAMPVHPPTAMGDQSVLVEIEMTARAEPRGYRILSPLSGFDAAAIDAVKTWRFQPPVDPEAPDRLFVYALVGFRAPVVPGP
jgi:hypothetical protein